MDAKQRAEFVNLVTRALIAIIFALTVSVAFLWGVVRDNIRIDAAAFIGVIVIAIGWWYGQQNDRKRATDPPTNGGSNAPATSPGPTPTP